MSQWQVVKLADVLEQITRQEKVQRNKLYRLMGVRWYAKGVFERERRYGREISTNYLYRIETGDLIYNRLFAWKGSFAIVDEASNGGYVSNEFPVFQVKADANPEYIKLQLSRKWLWRKIEQDSTGTTSTSRLRYKEADFLSLDCQLPPLPEQRKIAMILRSVDETIVRTETAIEYVSKVKQGVTEQLLTHNFEPTKFKNWSIVKLKNLGDISYGLTVNEQRRQAVERLPYLRVGNVYRGYLDLTELKEMGILNGDRERYKLIPGDALVVEGNADPNQIGRAALWRGEIAECLHQNHILRFRPDPEQVIPEYVMIYLNGRQSQAYFKLNAKTSSGLNTINSSVLGDISIAVPPLNEQQKIVNVVSEIDRRLNSEKVYKTRLEQVKRGLMQKLLSGEIRVTV